MSIQSDRKDVFYASVTDDKNVPTKINLPLFGIRHLQVLLLFILVIIAFGFRVILSVTIVTMTNSSSSLNPDVPSYNWKDKGTILSAFFWGYILPQVFAGYAANRFGVKWFLVTAFALQSLLSILTPVTAANFGSLGMCISRALQGACQGFIFPSVAHQMGHWVPPEERSRMGSFVFGAGPLGTVIAMLVAGLISASWYGWPWVFYVYGGFGIIWCLIFALLGSNSPADHTKISQAEKYYIENSFGRTEDNTSQKVPWTRILTSVPVWALFTVQLGYCYAYWTLLTQIPTYMNHVMQFNIKNNSMLSSLAYLTFWILTFIFGYLSDLAVNKRFASVTSARKIFNSIGLLVPASALVALGFTKGEQVVQGVVLLVIAVSFNAAAMSGWYLNHMDLSPNYAGTLMGLTNGFSHVSAVLAPLSVQFLVTDESNPAHWRIIFSIASGILVAVTIVFVIFGSGEVQPWNDSKTESRKRKTLIA